MANILGVSTGFHDAAVSLVDGNNGDILFASHVERYSKIKHDAELNNHSTLKKDLLVSATDAISTISYYENPLLKNFRCWYAGQEYANFFKCSVKDVLSKHTSFFDGVVSSDVKYNYFGHHLSHAAAGFQTSPFDKATVVVIDAIGEIDTISIWGAQYNKKGIATYKKLWSQEYPHSIGLLYSALTKKAGLKPLDEEYILMGMAGWGKPTLVDEIKNMIVQSSRSIILKRNVHIGLDDSFLSDASPEDIAASAQVIAEELIYNVMTIAKEFNWSNNLVYMGGVALNCLANRNLGNYFDQIWIMPNPGDAGSSLGAAALTYKKRLNWDTAYLGHSISGKYPVDAAMQVLLTNKIVGVASGRAEFGPRALGNRSLLADPRGQEIKDSVNEIKRRQKFRPFAPVILEEFVSQYFDMPTGFNTSPYMQVVAKCKYPYEYPAIIHVDGTSRVQTVDKNNSGIRALLEAWYKETGCPMLLNTSLNIRGEPMVNEVNDAFRFTDKYNVPVCI